MNLMKRRGKKHASVVIKRRQAKSKQQQIYRANAIARQRDRRHDPSKLDDEVERIVHDSHSNNDTDEECDDDEYFDTLDDIMLDPFWKLYYDEFDEMIRLSDARDYNEW